MSNYPSLVSEYIQYVNYKSEFEKTSKIDLSDMQFVFPTTLLPLSGIILKNKDKYIPPKSHKVENYISTILESTSSNFTHT